ncbi:hypothetical protein AKJ09_09529 [Labilithrix luteola]|uniref:Uncharacterized protein n=1 Tax=Labilithrix luteola TaxID=1391654 RepID=A0A0K1QAQ0_9BACT|nr:hypothetical protein AKJ09_09529 [Labilithrix luteola]
MSARRSCPPEPLSEASPPRAARASFACFLTGLINYRSYTADGPENGTPRTCYAYETRCRFDRLVTLATLAAFGRTCRCRASAKLGRSSAACCGPREAGAPRDVFLLWSRRGQTARDSPCGHRPRRGQRPPRRRSNAHPVLPRERMGLARAVLDRARRLDGYARRSGRFAGYAREGPRDVHDCRKPSSRRVGRDRSGAGLRDADAGHRCVRLLTPPRLWLGNVVARHNAHHRGGDRNRPLERDPPPRRALLLGRRRVGDDALDDRVARLDSPPDAQDHRERLRRALGLCRRAARRGARGMAPRGPALDGARARTSPIHSRVHRGGTSHGGRDSLAPQWRESLRQQSARPARPRRVAISPADHALRRPRSPRARRAQGSGRRARQGSRSVCAGASRDRHHRGRIGRAPPLSLRPTTSSRLAFEPYRSARRSARSRGGARREPRRSDRHADRANRGDGPYEATDAPRGPPSGSRTAPRRAVTGIHLLPARAARRGRRDVRRVHRAPPLSGARALGDHHHGGRAPTLPRRYVDPRRRTRRRDRLRQPRGGRHHDDRARSAPADALDVPAFRGGHGHAAAQLSTLHVLSHARVRGDLGAAPRGLVGRCRARR